MDDLAILYIDVTGASHVYVHKLDLHIAMCTYSKTPGVNSAIKNLRTHDCVNGTCITLYFDLVLSS